MPGSGRPLGARQLLLSGRWPGPWVVGGGAATYRLSRGPWLSASALFAFCSLQEKLRSVIGPKTPGGRGGQLYVPTRPPRTCFSRHGRFALPDFPSRRVLAWTPDPQCPALRRKATNYNSFSVIAADPQQALLDVCGTSRLGRQGLAAGPGPGAAAGDDGAEWPAGRHDAQPPEHGRGGENGRVAGRPRASYTSCHDIEPLRPPRLSPPAASCLLLQKGRRSLVPIKKVILSPGVSEDGKDRPAG